MTTENKVRILSTLTTRDEAGRHFTNRVSSTDLSDLEAEGLIAISRPVHQTGIEYSQEYWKVEVTEDGVALVETHPEYCAAE